MRQKEFNVATSAGHKKVEPVKISNLPSRYQVSIEIDGREFKAFGSSAPDAVKKLQKAIDQARGKK